MENRQQDYASQNPIVDYYRKLHTISDEEWHYLTHPEQRPIPSAMALGEGKYFLRELYNSQHKVITILPDYDADGITSGIIAYMGLQLLNIGKRVHLYYPDADDGFGLSPVSVDKALDQFPDTQIFLTTDNGISAIDGVNEANQRGAHVLITDHHQGGKQEPNGLAIVNPNRVNDPYPFKGLSGGGVIYKILHDYMETVDPSKKEALESLLPLVGISTVADVMPIIGENHTIVKQSLRWMNQPNVIGVMKTLMNQHPALKPYLLGLTALITALKEQKKAYQPYTEKIFGWVIGPILNTPRRLTNKPDEAFELFVQPSWYKASKQALHLIELNETRKTVVKETIATMENTPAFRHFQQNPSVRSFQTTAGHGVVGLIAGRLTNSYHVPTVVFSHADEDGYIQGSGRSPEGIHLLNILDKIYHRTPEIFKSYGGHASACGITIKESEWEAFNQQFELFGAQAVAKQPEIDVQAVPLSYPNPMIEPLGKDPFVICSEKDTETLLEAVKLLDNLAPFGHGFPPLQAVLTVYKGSVNPRIMGKQQNHLKMQHPDVGFDLIVWGDAKRIQQSSENYLTAIVSLGANTWNGKTSLQGIVDDYLLHDERTP